ncbi:MAG: M28 family peptidase, partial [Candidatus Heimdallarchaeota archaeon]
KIFSENTVLEIIKDLCLLGSRFSGTISEKRAQEYIIEQLNKTGIKHSEFEFEYQGWQRGTCNFSISSPEKEIFPSISLVLAPSTDEEGIVEIIIDGGGGSQTEMEKIKEKIPGRIVMVHSGKTEEGWLHRRIKYANAVKLGAKAFIFANHNPGQLFPTGSVRSNRIGEIPAIGISKETYEYLIESIRRYKEVVGKIFVFNHAQEDTSKHIIWDIPGHATDEIIAIGGHYDGHDLAQGATDNAGSIAVLLEVTRMIKENNVIPARTLRFFAFAVEEFGVVGSTIYVNKTDVSDIVTMINFDGLVGHVPTHIACNGYEELYNKIKEMESEFLYETTVSKNIITASDNYPFLCKGIPNMCIYGERPDPGAGRGYGHTSADTFDKISKLDAKLSLAFALVLIYELSKIEELPSVLTDNETIEILKDAKLEDNLKLLDKWPVKQ